MQEIHMLNNEMLYMVYRALWKRTLLFAVFMIYVLRFRKDKYLNHGNQDS